MRNKRWIIAAVLGGALLTIGIVTLVKPAAAPPTPPYTSVQYQNDHDGAEMARCREVVTADARCEAVWKRQREHFFGRSNKAVNRPDSQIEDRGGRE